MVMELVNRLLALARGEEGQDLLEYALLVALIALVAVAAITLTGTNVNAIFVSTGVYDCWLLSMDSSSTTCPPIAAAVNEFLNAVVNPSVYGDSSWIVAAVFACSFWFAKSATTAPWIASLCAVRK